jgi:predicted Zn-ribbon and HTH transcriptional regulator
VSPQPLRPLQTEQDENRHDRLTAIANLTPWQATEVLRILAGLAPEHVDQALRVVPAACRRCGHMVFWP